MQNSKVVLITGAGRRIGAAVARFLHAHGMNVVIHYRSATNEAKQLNAELNANRKNSAIAIKADLNTVPHCEKLIKQAQQFWQRLDVLVNNASQFYPTSVGEVKEAQWNELMNSNLKSAFFLSQAAAPFIAKQQGAIINITDIHAATPLKNYPVYCIAKAGLEMLTKSLAKELAPAVRVNAVAPGSILWPEHENELHDSIKKKIIENTALKRQGNADDIAKAVWFLIHDANYVTGQTLRVDGGRFN